jgi:DNA-directed RNA polymerase
MRHTVNELGEKVPHDVKYFYAVIQDGSGKSTIEEWADIGSNPLTSKSIKEIKKADHPFRFLRCCIEWREELTQGSARKSALPIAADHRNSAFAHQGMLLDNDAGKALVERCSNEDLYESVSDRHPYPRKLIKAVMVPWSYGGGKDSCVKKLKAYRIEHPGEIEALDYMTVPEIEELVDDIFELLETEFPACIEFRNAVDRDMTRAQARTDRDPTDGVEWSTQSKFDVHQKVFRAKRFKGWVAKGFEKDVEIRCKLPTDTVDWEGMKRKAAPNLVHSQDATVVHMLLSGAVEIEGINDHVPDGAVVYDPLVTVHDSFSVLPTDAKKALNGLAALTVFIYLNDPMVRWGESVIGQGFDTRERTLPELFGDGEPPYT